MIITNKIRCRKCDEIIESEYTHDFKWCSCHACAVDGGHDYLRRTGSLDNFDELSEIAEDETDELFDALRKNRENNIGKSIAYRSVISKGERQVTVYVPDLDIRIQGGDYSEALKMTRKAICDKLTIIRGSGKPFPKPSIRDAASLDMCSISAIIAVDFN